MIKKTVTTSLLFLLSVTLFAQATKKELADTYIRLYSSMAVREMQRSKVPASITLAQGILESDYGRGQLAKESKNHFGIKCGKDWNGGKVYHDDDAVGECFRKYESVEDSYADHSDFLSKKERYASLFTLETTDYKGWATGLKKAGYATDPTYATRLISLIEENKLYIFDSNTEGVVLKKDESKKTIKTKKTVDKFVIDPFFSHDIAYNNGVRYIKVKDGDTFNRISKEFGLNNWELMKYNDLSSNQKIEDLTYLYISPKKNKAASAHELHKVKKGETLTYISNKYGVKLNKLLSYNNLRDGGTIKEGDTIRLRSNGEKRSLFNF